MFKTKGWYQIRPGQVVCGDRTRAKRSVASLYAAVALAALGSGEQVYAQDTPDTEIVVTANKKSESVQDVPSSIAVLGGAEIQSKGVQGFQEYMTLVPGLATNSTGSETNGALIIRGLNTGGFQYSSTASYYIDETPFTASGPNNRGSVVMLDTDLTDVDHIEVLKGPQSTLYGAGALGGLVKIVMNQPDLARVSGKATVEGSATEGGGEGYNAAGVINIPLVSDVLAVRASVYSRYRPGYLTNARTGSRNLGSVDKQGFRLSAKWKPSDTFDAVVSWQKEDATGDGWNYMYVDVNRRPTIAPYTHTAAFDAYSSSKFDVFNATMNLKVGGVGTLTSTTSYAKYDNYRREDITPAYGLFNEFAPVAVPANAVMQNERLTTLRKTSQEIRFTTERLGRFEAMIGGFFTDEDARFASTLTNLPGGTPIPAGGAFVGTLEYVPGYKEYAAFGNLTYHITDSLELTGGLRYSKNKQSYVACRDGFIFGLNTLTCFDAPFKDSDLTYLVTATWKVTDDISTYARVASAYRPGAAQIVNRAGFDNFYRSDSIVNYEAGIKAEMLDRRLRANLAVYQMDWKDLQVPSSQVILIIANAGKAVVKGVEFDGSFRPVPGLAIGASVSYIDAKLRQIDQSVSTAIGGVSGDRLPFTPKWSGAATIDYSHDVGSDIRLSYGLVYRYQGARLSGYAGDQLNTGVRMPSYSMFDLSAGVKWGSYQIQARVANLFDKRVITSMFNEREVPGQNVPFAATVSRPRTFSLGFGVEF